VSFRATSRVLLFDPLGRVLMFLQYGKDRSVAPRWITPGGGVDPGEDHDQAAIREVREETGYELAGVPAPFAESDFAPDQRWHPYDEGHWSWYAIPVPSAFEPSREGWTEEEQADVVEGRWMTADELAADEFEVEPADLPEMVRTHAPLPVYAASGIDPAGLVVGTFDRDDAMDLGAVAVSLIRELHKNLAVRIVLHGETVFEAKLGTTGDGNDPWLAGKARVVERFGEPSLRVRRTHEEGGTPFADRDDVDHELFKAHGGSIPIRVGDELVGTITMSGEPDVVDHAVCAEAVRRFSASRG
jgi:uncharacterized protein (UPF0303 family)/8-oxo-dGTP pyrophosphatase MutT (NUDIX family)